jgi:hypothetical protein
LRSSSETHSQNRGHFPPGRLRGRRTESTARNVGKARKNPGAAGRRNVIIEGGMERAMEAPKMAEPINVSGSVPRITKTVENIVRDDHEAVWLALILCKT